MRVFMRLVKGKRYYVMELKGETLYFVSREALLVTFKKKMRLNEVTINTIMSHLDSRGLFDVRKFAG